MYHASFTDNVRDRSLRKKNRIQGSVKKKERRKKKRWQNWQNRDSGEGKIK